VCLDTGYLFRFAVDEDQWQVARGFTMPQSQRDVAALARKAAEIYDYGGGWVLRQLAY
jgi:hypothetical protein